MNDPIRQAHDALVKKAADDGKLIEAGFLALAAQCLPAASAGAVHAARMIYMAGAQHLFASLMVMMDEEHEPTPQDMRRMSLIDAELRAIEPHLAAWVSGPGEGPTQ